MDILKINWRDRAHNDPVVNYLFSNYIFEKEHLKQKTNTPVVIKDGAKSLQKQPSSEPAEPNEPKKSGKVGRPPKKTTEPK